MPDEINWAQTTFEGNRRRQHEEFRALPFLEKLKRIEEMGEIVAHFAASRGPVADGDGGTGSPAREEPRPTGQTPDRHTRPD